MVFFQKEREEMNISERFNDLIKERKEIEGDVDFDTNPIIKSEVDLFTADIEESIRFIRNDCTGEQFTWLSEIFEDIALKVKSKEFIRVLYETADKYPQECKEYNIISFIDDARDIIE